MNNKQVWQATLDRLRYQTTKPVFDTWLRGAKLLSAQEQCFIVGVPNSYAKHWLEAHLLYTIQAALATVTGTEAEVAITVLNTGAGSADEDLPAEPGTLWAQATETESATEEEQTVPARPPAPLIPGPLPTPPFTRPLAAPAPARGNSWRDPKLNPRYTFETFIVGKSNEMAHAAAAATAAQPGRAYNPLFLWGGVGLGKTHLLHAIGHLGLEQDLEVLYVSSETFTNEIILAIRAKTTDAFRAKYRTVDVLLIDDIQFIAGKDSTEEEFFHTFNTLYESEKQIVMCSDRPPKAIVTLEERLRSRFEWGLTADIVAPDFETRVAILRDKAEQLQRDIPPQVIDYLANRIRSNIRELEGCLNRVLAYSDFNQVPVTLDLAKTAIESLLPDARSRSLTTDLVLDTVATYYKVSMEDLKGRQREKEIVLPRHVCMYLMRQHTEASLLEIGQALGGRDHSTVLHGYEKINGELDENTALRRDVLAIQEQLVSSVK